VTGLTAADFEIFDNGVRQEVTTVTYAKLPIDVTIALDVSYSVTGLMLERLRRGVVQLMADLSPQDRLKLLLFNNRVARTVDFTNDAAAVEAAIRNAAAGGGTSLLDAMSVAMLTATAPDRRQLLVVFADGTDSTSTTTPAMLSSVALRSRATIALVMPPTRALSGTPSPAQIQAAGGSTRTTILAGVTTLNPNPTTTISAVGQPGRPLDNLFISLIANTGGAFVPVGTTTDLTTLFRQILSAFRSAYVLQYRVQGVDQSGYHALEVKVNRPNVTVDARRGYWY
jgi:VWFA-related protein